ncbi:hypothetical protein HK101_001075 [Irineochytrium annulatum]|nr:hypothetical protein HK101_001075 [Irineochytrium annulatum]
MSTTTASCSELELGHDRKASFRKQMRTAGEEAPALVRSLMDVGGMDTPSTPATIRYSLWADRIQTSILKAITDGTAEPALLPVAMRLLRDFRSLIEQERQTTSLQSSHDIDASRGRVEDFIERLMKGEGHELNLTASDVEACSRALFTPALSNPHPILPGFQPPTPDSLAGKNSPALSLFDSVNWEADTKAIADSFLASTGKVARPITTTTSTVPTTAAIPFHANPVMAVLKAAPESTIPTSSTVPTASSTGEPFKPAHLGPFTPLTCATSAISIASLFSKTLNATSLQAGWDDRSPAAFPSRIQPSAATTSDTVATSSSVAAAATATTHPTDVPTVSSVRRVTTSGTRTIIEEPASCAGCGAPFATMVLRGEHAAFEKPHTVDVRCVPCSAEKARPSADAAAAQTGGEGGGGGDDDDGERAQVEEVVIPSRKRARGAAEHVVSCDVCRHDIGTGGVKVSMSRPRASSASAPTSPKQPKAEEFSVEVVCASCRDGYAFCTECGGGGKHRTGKYRPLELFVSGRRTCTLSHVRLGDARVSTVVHDLALAGDAAASKVDAKLLEDCRGVLADGVLSHFATPKAMEAARGSRLRTVAAIRGAVDVAWTAIVRDVATAPMAATAADVGGRRRRYMGVAYIPKVVRKKARARQGAAAAGVVVHGDDVSPPVDGVQAAFVTAEVDAGRGVMRVCHLGARTMAMQSPTLARDLVARVAARAQRELVGATGRGVEHVWVRVEREEQRMEALCAKLGAVPLATYLKRHRGVDGALFDGDLAGGSTQVYVVRADELMTWLKE